MIDYPDVKTAPRAPAPPDDADQLRRELSIGIWHVLEDDWDEEAGDWIELICGKERAKVLGHPDTSMNDLAEFSAQMSTPGFYGRRPKLVGKRGSAPLIDHNGYLDQAGWHTKGQRVNYYSIGLGDFLVGMDASVDDGLSLTLAPPHEFWAKAHPEKPDVAARLYRLMLHYWAEAQLWVWTYHVWSVYPGEEPYYRIIIAQDIAVPDGKGDFQGVWKRGTHVTHLFAARTVTQEDGTQVVERPPPEGYVGDAYPYTMRSADPFIPWTFYRSVDSGKMWNHKARKGAYRATLNTAKLSTYVNTAALDATGSCIIVANMVPMTSNVTDGGSKEQVASVTLKPGSILYHQQQGEGQPFVKEIGPAANLSTLSEYQLAYTARTAARFGVNSMDATRKAANPASAAALAISDSSRREFMAQLEPMFRKADLELIGKCAAVLNRVMGISLPEDGYRITYYKIPRTPQEEEDQRKDWDWKLQHGQISEVEVYMAANPGTTEVQAIEALAQVQARQAALKMATEKALRDMGVEPEAASDEIPPEEEPESTPEAA